MGGKTVVITGGTSGIGEVAWRETLAKMGARIVLIARTSCAALRMLARLRSQAPNLAHAIYFADLTRLSER